MLNLQRLKRLFPSVVGLLLIGFGPAGAWAQVGPGYVPIEESSSTVLSLIAAAFCAVAMFIAFKKPRRVSGED